MPAAITDHFRRASSGTTRPVATYLASDKTNGATTAVLNAATGWNTTTGVDVIIYRQDTSGAIVPGTQTDWIATLAGSTLSNMTLKAGTEPANGYPAGTQSVVIASPTAAWADSMVEGILLEHGEDGTHDPTKVAMLAGTQTFTGNKTFSGTVTLPNNSVDANEISTSAITLGYSPITSNVTLGSSSLTLVTGLSATVTIPSGGRRVKITVWTGGVTNSTVNNTFLSIWDGTVGSGTQLAESTMYVETATFQRSCAVTAIVTPAAGSKTYNVGLKSGGGNPTVVASSTSPAFILVECI